MNLEDVFKSKAHARVLDFLLGNQDRGFSQRYIARMTGLAPSTVGLVLETLEKIGLVHQHSLGQVKLITLRQDTEIAKTLASLYTMLAQISPKADLE
jgi:DNA-binding IclR family transcriptional regulator